MRLKLPSRVVFHFPINEKVSYLGFTAAGILEVLSTTHQMISHSGGQDFLKSETTGCLFLKSVLDLDRVSVLRVQKSFNNFVSLNEGGVPCQFSRTES